MRFLGHKLREITLSAKMVLASVRGKWVSAKSSNFAVKKVRASAKENI